MRRLNLYWRSNRDWWEFDNHIPVIKKDAPPEAQESYKLYLQQISGKKRPKKEKACEIPKRENAEPIHKTQLL